jgi:hypothetical protein
LLAPPQVEAVVPLQYGLRLIIPFNPFPIATIKSASSKARDASNFARAGIITTNRFS